MRVSDIVGGALRRDFVWGASTSSYQVEGAAREDGRAPSIWDTFSHEPGRIANGHNGDVACDHYHRYAGDARLMRDLGLGAYRFSVSWPRVLPRGRGEINDAGLDFYDRLIDTLLENGVEPWLCLYHWDLPQALGDLGGWVNRDMAGWFADYAALVGSRYGDRVKRFATFNEPSVFLLFGYLYNQGAPGIADKASYFQAMHTVNLAHGAAVDVLRGVAPGASLGAVHNRQPCIPSSDAPEDREAALLFDAHWNRAYPDPQHRGHYPTAIWSDVEPYVKPGDMARICRPLDWFGMNHYSPNYIKANPGGMLNFAWGDLPFGAAQSGVGWHIAPDAFRDELIRASKHYRLPVYVTENGYGSTSDSMDESGQVNDPNRVQYLQAYIKAMGEAVAAGADVRGYFVWSLLDNFEWGAGYDSRFGIVYVDYATQARIPKSSARWYADLIRDFRARS